MALSGHTVVIFQGCNLIFNCLKACFLGHIFYESPVMYMYHKNFQLQVNTSRTGFTHLQNRGNLFDKKIFKINTLLCSVPFLVISLGYVLQLFLWDQCFFVNKSKIFQNGKNVGLGLLPMNRNLAAVSFIVKSSSNFETYRQIQPFVVYNFLYLQKIIGLYRTQFQC